MPCHQIIVFQPDEIILWCKFYHFRLHIYLLLSLKKSLYSHDFFINISLTVSFKYSLTFSSKMNNAQTAQMFQIPQKRLLVEDKFFS